MKTFSLFLIPLLSLTACMQPKPSTERATSTSFKEPYRSQYHFTPASGWMNDPNGMVYYEGEYHLFYQHYPDSTVWGPMHWGHAVSKDMMYWEHLPIALYPDTLGYIFSGSAVIDWKNTSGFGSAGTPPMVAIFTYHNMEGERAGNIDFQTQGIAYSLDKGRTWTKYENNPVVPNPGIRDFRDPKVSWNKVAHLWMMTLAVKDHIEFYGSPDLKKWNKVSEFGKTMGAHGGVWECPDLFPLKDEQGNTHWVLLVSINPGGPQGGSATQYFVGKFDGKKFTSQDSVTRWIDYGADNYAGVTWSDIPERDGRRLFIGWMSNWQYANVVPTEAWRSATTLPREITLNKKVDGYELKFKPVDEVSKIQGSTTTYTNSATVDSPLFMMEFKMEEGSKEFALIISNESDEKVVISSQGNTLSFDRTASGTITFNPVFAAIHNVDLKGVEIKKVNVYVDMASVELFINDGERVLTEIVFPSQPFRQVRLDKKNPQFSITPISSIWK